MYKTFIDPAVVLTASTLVADSYDNEVRNKILLALIEKGLTIRKASAPSHLDYEAIASFPRHDGKMVNASIGIPMTMDDLTDVKETTCAWSGDVVEILSWNIVVSTCQEILESYEHNKPQAPAVNPRHSFSDPAFSVGVDCFNDCPYGYACDVCPRYIPSQNTY